ncbi:MAG: hypothetical protein ACJ8EB_09000 [Allosphingosinicella sp.]
MKIYLKLALATAAVLPGTALAQLPLNTGLDYTNFTLYPMPTGSSSVADNYWILVSSSGPLVPATPGVPRPAYVVNTSSSWAPPLSSPPPGSRWISATPTSASLPGASSSNPSYFIFRKCFCLMNGYKNVQISYSLRADEGTQVWLNTLGQVMSGPSPVNFGPSSPPVNGGTNNAQWFHTGLNCMYVLVEDTGGLTGVNLAGQVSGLGVMATAGAGSANPPSFAPCQCGGPTGTAAAKESRATLQAIVQYAEARLRERKAAAK